MCKKQKVPKLHGLKLICNLLFIVLGTLLSVQASAAIANIVTDITESKPNLSTFATALKAGDLLQTLDGHGSFTVFAPTNDAFSALPKGVLANLLKPVNKAKLFDILAYHVLGNEVYTDALLDGEMLRTLQKKYVTVRLSGTDIFINSAKIATANVTASNGVIHAIDAVLLPGGPAPNPGPASRPQSLVELVSATPSLSTLATAQKAGDLVDTLEGIQIFGM